MNKIHAALILTAACASCYASEVSDRPMVWAHNTPWFRPEDNSLFASWFYNYPTQASQDTPAIRQESLKEEFRIASWCGINGMFLDMGADPDKGPMHWSFILADYLKAAEGTDFQLGLCRDGGNRGVEYESSELLRILNENADHPNYPKYQGKPMVFTYLYGQYGIFKPEEWKAVRQILKDNGREIFLVANVAPPPYDRLDMNTLEKYVDVYDGVYFFDPATQGLEPISVSNRKAAEFCHEHGKVFFPSLHPGYLTEWQLGNDFYAPFRGVDVLLMTTEEAKKTPYATHFHLTTWNDLFETALLPRTFKYGSTRLLRYCANYLKGHEIVSEEPEVIFAWHREEVAGTLLRLEAVSLPTSYDKHVTIEGHLEDLDGKNVATLQAKSVDATRLGRMEWLIPTANLACSPTLVPKFTVICADFKRSITAPAVMLVSSWLHNPVTVDFPLSQSLADFPNTLKITGEGLHATAEITFNCFKPLRRIVLFKNDRPIGLFTPDIKDDELVFPVYIKDDANMTINNGRIIRALKKCANYNGCGNFSWDGNHVYSQGASDGTVLTLAGSPEMSISVTPLETPDSTTEVKVDDIVVRRRIVGRGWSFIAIPDNTTYCDNPQPLPPGTMKLSFWNASAWPSDFFYVRYETTDGQIFMTPPIFPFADGNPQIEAVVLATDTTLETTTGAAGLNLRDISEFITPADEVPIKGTATVRVSLSRLGEHHARWHFDGTSYDTATMHGDLFAGLTYPAEMYVEGGVSGKCLKFTGTQQLLLRKRSWPLGGFGHISFHLNPAPLNGKKQSVIFRSGWEDGLLFNLLEDGRVEVLRGYSVNKSWDKLFESMVSKTALVPGQWAEIETRGDAKKITLFINGQAEASLELTPSRNYGDESIFIGGGLEGYENYNGLLDELALDGLPE